MRKGERTRQRIIEQAAALLNQRGYQGLAYSDLMEATGLEKGGIYRHFSCKESLAAEAFEFAWRSAVRARTEDVDALTNTVDQLKQLVTNFVTLRTVVPGGCPLLNVAVDADDGNEVLRTQARKALRDWIASLVRVTRRGQRQGEIRQDLEGRRMGRLLIATLEGALMISRLEKKPDALEEAQSHLHDYLEREVRATRVPARED